MARDRDSIPPGAMPLIELERIDSEVRHIGERLAESRLDVEGQRRLIDAMREDIRTWRMLAKAVVIGVPILVTLMLTVGPWLIRASVESVLVQHHVLKVAP